MSLFDQQHNRPLADKVRPNDFTNIVGQDHLVGENGLINKMLETDSLSSLILWGPPGCGKTTIARAIAENTDAVFTEVSAVRMGKQEVLAAIKDAQARKNLNQDTILFVDEIHRFNKAQQDMFLPFVEDGTIILIGATTENPSFEVIAPLLSRSTLAVLKSLSLEDLKTIIANSVKQLPGKSITPSAKKLLVNMAQGDARSALTGLEIAAGLSEKSITKKHIEQAMQQVGLKYDKSGEDHYNTISAFIKSMRGSNEQAALYYMQRMLNAGEDPKFIARRIVIFASEDIGMASPHALTLAVAVFEAVDKIGLPEANYTLTQGVVAMCQAKKSRSIDRAMTESKKLAKDYPNASIPLHLRNAPTQLMKDLGYGKNYNWEADFKPDEGFLPEEIPQD